MRFGVWRHENALGNSAEQILNISNQITACEDKSPRILIETDFQGHMARLIPNAVIERWPLSNGELEKLNSFNKDFFNSRFDDVLLPDAYFDAIRFRVFPSTWRGLKGKPNKLFFPSDYIPKISIEEPTIVIQFREAGTYWKRVDGANSEPERFVDPRSFHQLAIKLANLGFKVFRTGDSRQQPMPNHPNICDLTRQENWNLLDDLYVISRASLCIFTDSGIWPLAAALGRLTLITNIASDQDQGRLTRPWIFGWLPNTTTCLRKSWNGREYLDNSVDEIFTESYSLLRQ